MDLKLPHTTNILDLRDSIDSSRYRVAGLVRHFTVESSLHGVKYIGIRNLHVIERIFWICSVVTAFGFSVFLVQQVYQKFNDNPVIISFQPTEAHVSQVPFPAITICDSKSLRREGMHNMLSYFKRTREAYLTANDTSKEVLLEKLQEAVYVSEYITQFCLAAPSFRRVLKENLLDARGNEDELCNFENTMSILGPFPYLTESNVTTETLKILREYGRQGLSNCSDIVVRCMWAQKIIPCEDIFSPVRTEHGFCCQFNALPVSILRSVAGDRFRKRTKSKNREVWKRFEQEDLILNKGIPPRTELPFRQKSGGKQYGLTLLVNPELDQYSTCNSNDGWGFTMTAHSPISFPSVNDFGAGIPINTELFVDVDPQITVANKKTLESIHVKKRGCYFPSDPEAKLKSYKFYSAENCLDECLAKYTFQNCSCLQSYMPRSNRSTHPRCSARQRECSESVRVNVMTQGTSGGLCSQCLPACTDINYVLRLSYLPLRDGGTHRILHTYNDSQTNIQKIAANYTIVHIFVGRDSFNVKERKRLYDFWDLLASAGGLLGLTLGFSIISVVEILYFFTIRVWFHIRDGGKASSEDNENDEKDNSFIPPSSATKGITPKLFSTSNVERNIQGFSYHNKKNSLIFGYY